MKKTIAVLMLIALLLSGCSSITNVSYTSAENSSNDSEKLKLDKSQPFILTEYSNPQIDIIATLRKKGTEYEINSTIGLMTHADIRNGIIPAKDRLGVNEKITLNLNSDDARYVQSKLTDQLALADSISENFYNEMNAMTEGALPLAAFSYVMLGQTYETDSLISMTVYQMQAKIGTEAHAGTVENYVFSKIDGHLMSAGETLASAGYTLSEIENTIRDNLKTMDLTSYSDNGTITYRPDLLNTRTSLTDNTEEFGEDAVVTLALDYDNPFMLCDQGLLANTVVYDNNYIFSSLDGPKFTFNPKTPLAMAAKTPKVDDSKEYIVSTSIETSLSKLDLSDQKNASIKAANAELAKDPANKIEIQTSDRINVNIDSDDARLVSMILDHQLSGVNFNKLIRRTLHSTATYKTVVSLSVRDIIYRIDSRTGLKIDESIQTYSFDTETGFLLSPQAILKQTGKTLDDVNAKTANFFDAHPYQAASFKSSESVCHLTLDEPCLTFNGSNPYQISNEGKPVVYVQYLENYFTRSIIKIVLD